MFTKFVTILHEKLHFYFFLYVYELLGVIYFHSIFLNLAIFTYIQKRFLKIKFFFESSNINCCYKKVLWFSKRDVTFNYWCVEWMKKIFNKKRIFNYIWDEYEMNVAINNCKTGNGQHNQIHSNHPISLFLFGIK